MLHQLILESVLTEIDLLGRMNASISVIATNPKVIQVGMATAGMLANLIEMPANAHRMTAA